MQVSVYISEKDFAQLSKSKHAEHKTVSAYMGHIIRDKAQDLRTLTNAAGDPVILTYPRE